MDSAHYSAIEKSKLVKVPKEVVMSAALVKRIKELEFIPRVFADPVEMKFGLTRIYFQAELFLLGRDEEGVYVDAVLLKKTRDSCNYFPDIDARTMVKAYLELSVKGLTPGGFVHVLDPKVHTKRQTWDFGPLGTSILEFIGQIYICFNPDPEAFVCVCGNPFEIVKIPIIIKE